MRFDLKTPCVDCPFLRARRFPLTLGRVREILRAVTAEQKSFSCHKTVDYGDGEAKGGEQHCAGAAILLERINRPNQLMRWMERLGAYDRTKMDMKADVYSSPSEMLGAEHWMKR